MSDKNLSAEEMFKKHSEEFEAWFKANLPHQSSESRALWKTRECDAYSNEFTQGAYVTWLTLTGKRN